MTLSEYIESIKSKKITVIGAGISNRPLIRLFAENGLDVTVCDKADALHEELADLNIITHLGSDYLDNIDGDLIFRTPGLHPFTAQLVAAKNRGAEITSEMEVFLKLCPCRVIAVTGSDGKTTTTTLISELLKCAGYHVFLGGNIGHPLLCQVTEMNPDDMVVLELSSFQLHSMNCHPDVAVVTNLAPNHLDVHPDYQDYINAKKQIFINQSNTAKLVLNADNADTKACASDANGEVQYFSRKIACENGVFLTEAGDIIYSHNGHSEKIMNASEIRLPGVHNIENMMAAFAATADLVDQASMVKVAKEFAGVAHRLETVRILHGVRYINDSIASSPSRTIAGLSCFKDKIILIAGGKDKGVPFDDLGPSVCEHVKKLYLTGFTAEKIKTAVESTSAFKPGAPEIYLIDDFKECVLTAANNAEEGDTIILSPASTSFDRFKNFEHRGNTFREIIEELS